MIGSIDILAIISKRPVASMAIIGRLSGNDDQPPLVFAACEEGGRAASLIKKVVARKATKITAPASQKVARMPISGGRNPPMSGPTRFPAIMPVVSVPSAQPDWALGVCVATSVIEPDE